MPKATRTIIAVAVIVIFGALGIWSLLGTATPYVDFAQAKAMKSRVQVMGKVDKASAMYDMQTGVFSFDIFNETGEVMKVNFSGTKPGNFEQAESIVCIGRYDNGGFEAKELLVKCPSKYQGQEYQEQIDKWNKGG